MGKTSKMKAALILIAVWMLSCAVMQGAERGFDDIVRAISDQFHTQAAAHSVLRPGERSPRSWRNRLE